MARVVAVCLLLLAASAGPSSAAPRFAPVIGAPAAVPAQPKAGQPFAVSFPVRRSDTRAPVAGATVRADVLVGAVRVAHSESFRRGAAAVLLLVPTTAEGERVHLDLAVIANRRTAHRSADFRVAREPLPVVSVAAGAVAEGQRGETSLVFPITLSTARSQPVWVSYETMDGTATAGTDYAAASGRAVIEAGDTLGEIAVTVLGDVTYEGDETVGVTISAPVNATLGAASATGTILDDELVLDTPVANAVVPQNVASADCAQDSFYGSGFTIAFSWHTNDRTDITTLYLWAAHAGATLPLVSWTMTPDVRSYTFRSCRSFVADGNLQGWEWAMRATDGNGATLGFARGTFSFAPCRLSNGLPCGAAIRPTADRR